MDSSLISLIIQGITALITIVYIILIFRTIKSNENLNQKILFDRITKEERELRIKFQEYHEKIDNKNLTKKERKNLIFAYETLLFNYYEYLAICLHKNLISENDAKLYFKFLLKSVKEYFEVSLLFKKGAAKKQEYPGIQWLFKKWKV